MRRVTPFYVGSRFVSGVPLPKERTLVVNAGGLLGTTREVMFKLWGISPFLKRSLQRLNPLLLHAHYGMNGLRLLPMAQAINRPLVVTFHGFDATISDESAKESFYGHRQYALHKDKLKSDATLFIAVSEFIRKKLIDQGFSRDKIVVHHIGVDTELFQPSKVISRLPIVLFVGRLVEKKGCEYLIRAMSGLQTALGQVELVIIGEGPLRGQLESLARRTCRQYKFVGLQSPESVREHMNTASVLAVPSVTAESGDAEGLPTVVAEAMAMGLPIVASRSAGIPEAIADGQNGFLVRERDHWTLGERILTLISDRQLRDVFSRAGRRRVEEDFDVLKQSAVLEDIYFDVCSHLPSRSHILQYGCRDQESLL